MDISNEMGGGEGQDIPAPGSSNSADVPVVATIPVQKPVVGDIKLSPSKTQVYLGNKAGYADICNYTFDVAGTEI